jgi:hypothetical protein
LFADDKPWYVEHARALGLFAYQADTLAALAPLTRSLQRLKKELTDATTIGTQASSSSSQSSGAGQSHGWQRSWQELQKTWPQYMGQALQPLASLLTQHKMQEAANYVDNELLPRLQQYPQDLYLTHLGYANKDKMAEAANQMAASRESMIADAYDGKFGKSVMRGDLSKVRYQVLPYKQLGFTRETRNVTAPACVHTIIVGLEQLAKQDFSQLPGVMQALDGAIRAANSADLKHGFHAIKLQVEMFALLHEQQQVRTSIVGKDVAAPIISSKQASSSAAPIGGARSRVSSMAELVSAFAKSLRNQMGMLNLTTVTPLAVANALVNQRIYPLVANMVDELTQAQGISSQDEHTIKLYTTLDGLLPVVTGFTLKQLSADPDAHALLQEERLFKGAIAYAATVTATCSEESQMPPLSSSSSSSSLNPVSTSSSLSSISRGSSEDDASLESPTEASHVSDHATPSGTPSDTTPQTVEQRQARLAEIRGALAAHRAEQAQQKGPSSPHH